MSDKNIAMSEDACTEEDLIIKNPEIQRSGARGSWLRWLLLTFGCFFLFGSYYCYDIPSALAIYLKKEPYNLSDA